MKITNEIVEHNSKYYARVIVCKVERVVAGTIWRSINGKYYEADPSAVGWSDSALLYIPIKVPEGYPDKWVVLKDNDIIGKDTLCFESRVLNKIGEHGYGKYSEVCKSFPLWESHLMFNPAKTSQSNYIKAEKSGIIEAWKSGKEIEYSVNGKDWGLSSTPNFCLDVQWRVKTPPITPPKFDWRLIIKGEEPKGGFLVMNDVNPKNMTTAWFNHGRWEDYSSKQVFPTHYTTLEE